MDWQRWRARAAKLRNHPRRLRFLTSRLLWHTGLSPWFRVSLPDGLRIRFYPSSISAALWVSPNERSEDADLVRRLLRAGERYVDCGANVGHLALVARSVVGIEGKVIAIEANPRIFSYCVGNLKLNRFDDVVAVNVALGEKAGSVRITDRRDDDQNRVGTDSGDAVPMQPLDQVVEAGPVALLKLDVEGYELYVLRGAQRILTTTDVVYCELSASNCERFGYHPREVEDLLLDRGFVFVRNRGNGAEFVRERIYDSLIREAIPRTGFNLLAIKADKVTEFQRRLAKSQSNSS